MCRRTFFFILFGVVGVPTNVSSDGLGHVYKAGHVKLNDRLALGRILFYHVRFWSMTRVSQYNNNRADGNIRGIPLKKAPPCCRSVPNKGGAFL